jgi:hypothetical protein
MTFRHLRHVPMTPEPNASLNRRLISGRPGGVAAWDAVRLPDPRERSLDPSGHQD